jgi:hypothetical protein
MSNPLGGLGLLTMCRIMVAALVVLHGSRAFAAWNHIRTRYQIGHGSVVGKRSTSFSRPIYRPEDRSAPPAGGRTVKREGSHAGTRTRRHRHGRFSIA